jgi:fructose-specific phosphotransferase system component IIB
VQREPTGAKEKMEGKKQLSLTIKRAINSASELIEVACMSRQEARQGYQGQEAAEKPMECEGRSLCEEAAKENYK